ncbi:class II SORL domain-containing protein [Acetomicrobium sp. S15 = DSM 107314]|jgi:superoxide reductase|uniref:class II SORL domain-containing protein n=1 Tax=Acetomicrobium sp. S15 = DSM 107314 TaxID=2529858 RepID=UPI0018E0D0BA|nr:class II SORL domain-containing protein [Acetomicrobium sp. S15 = DSM 107314]
MKFADIMQSADWKAEKHVPVIEAPDSVKAGEFFNVTLTVGKEIPHPNTTEHHIRWIKLLFKPEGDKFAYELANFEFTAHGEAVAGANQGPAYTDSCGVARVKLNSSGTLLAMSYCNIHGLWESSKEIKVG